MITTKKTGSVLKIILAALTFVAGLQPHNAAAADNSSSNTYFGIAKMAFASVALLTSGWLVYCGIREYPSKATIAKAKKQFEKKQTELSNLATDKHYFNHNTNEFVNAKDKFQEDLNQEITNASQAFADKKELARNTITAGAVTIVASAYLLYSGMSDMQTPKKYNSMRSIYVYQF